MNSKLAGTAGVVAAFCLGGAAFIATAAIALDSGTEKSVDPTYWTDSAGKIDPAKVPERIPVATELTKSGVAYVSSAVVLGTAKEPFDAFSTPDSDQIVGWYYPAVGIVPVGTEKSPLPETTPTTVTQSDTGVGSH